jgi:hypothetical protein
MHVPVLKGTTPHMQASRVRCGSMRAACFHWLVAGRDLAARVAVFSTSGTPLAYVWPPGHSAEPYLGAAHGLIGILYALLVLQQHAPQCMPHAQRDLADIRAALRCGVRAYAAEGARSCKPWHVN